MFRSLCSKVLQDEEDCDKFVDTVFELYGRQRTGKIQNFDAAFSGV